MNYTFAYDRAAMVARTKASPTWLHFGAGNIFRAFPCALVEKLLADGVVDRGIIVAEGFDEEIVEHAYRPYDNTSLLVTLCGDGEIKKTPIGSVAESLCLSNDKNRLKEIACAPSLQLISFTITEKGYVTNTPAGELTAAIKADIDGEPCDAKTTVGAVTALLYARYGCGALPISLVSMDNCSGNGDKLKSAILTVARGWCTRGVVDGGFVDYITDESKVAFPCSMIDKITPRPSDAVAEMIAGECDTELIVTKKGTYTAAFVNAEAPQYLVVEDKFPAGKPPIDTVGVIFTDKKTVDKSEKMKVCTCLNPLHTALAVFGCLLGYTLISEEMKDAQLVRLVRRLGYDEGLPVVTDPVILSPREFIDEVVGERLPNPFMPDAPQRIATDTSQKLPIRFGETIKAYIERGLPMTQLTAIPLVAAGWCRYLMAIDDGGDAFEPSSDPRLQECMAHLFGIALGETDREKIARAVSPLLSDETIFGVNLYETPLGARAENYFAKMVKSKNAVRKTLADALGGADE